MCVICQHVCVIASCTDTMANVQYTRTHKTRHADGEEVVATVVEAVPAAPKSDYSPWWRPPARMRACADICIPSCEILRHLPARKRALMRIYTCARARVVAATIHCNRWAHARACMRHANVLIRSFGYIATGGRMRVHPCGKQTC